MAHLHSTPETTLRDFIENAVASYLKRNYPVTPHPASNADELIENICSVLNCSICSRRLQFTQPNYSVLYKKIDKEAKRPQLSHDDDAGFDLFALYTTDLLPNTLTEIRTGIALELPNTLYCSIDGKSSFHIKDIFTYRGIIDTGYRGEITVFMKNNSRERVTIQKWQKFAQLIFHHRPSVEMVVTDKLNPSKRGEGRWGSTGKF